MKILSSEEVFQVLVAKGFRENIIFVADRQYCCFQDLFVAKDFARDFREFCTQLELQYEVDVFDCDDFETTASFFAKLVNKRSNPTAAVAFGFLWYTREDGEGHAINPFLTLDSSGLTVKFFEPQNQTLVELSESEIRSCALVVV